MATLFAGLDHIASLRQAGGTRDPDPAIAAALAELAGASGVTVTCGRDRRGMQERDLRLLRETSRTILNICLPPMEDFIKLALAIRPDLVTLTPEAPEGFGMERGLDVEDRRAELEPQIETLKGGGIEVGVLLDPAPAQIKAAHRAGAGVVLLHTGRFCWAGDGASRAEEFERLVNAGKIGRRLGLAMHAGGGLNYQTAGEVAKVPEIEAIHVGHSLVARTVLVGMGEAVRELLRALTPGSASGGSWANGSFRGGGGR
jgi:pyridoxine 5-phosphate synthase